MEGRCERHLFDRAVDLCGRCGGEFCADCLVYSFGPKKPPFCLPCAVEAAGVRNGSASRPGLSRKEAKAFAKRREELIAQREHVDPSRAAVLMDDSWMSKLEETA